MAYTASWTTVAPTGAAAANTADDEIRKLRLDLEERLEEFLIADMSADPVVANSALVPTGQLAHVYESAAGSVPTASATTITWFAETIDTGSFHDNDTNQSRLTITDAGYYQLYGSLTLFSGSQIDTVTTMEIRKNAASTVAIAHQYHLGGTTNQTFHIGVKVLAAASDYYEVRFTQASGQTWSIGAATDESFFEITKLAAA